MKTPDFTTDDVISLDETLPRIILAGLKKFKEELVKSKYGSYPAEMFDLIGVEGFNPTIGEDEDCWHKWLEILDKMIYSFDPAEEPDMYEYGFEFKWESGPTENGNSLVSIDVTNREEYDRYRKDGDEWERKCKEGRILFAEYFHNLWI